MENGSSFSKASDDNKAWLALGEKRKNYDNGQLRLRLVNGVEEKYNFGKNNAN